MSCIVYGCKNVWHPASTVKFHSFPKDQVRRIMWLNIIRLKGCFYESARICSDHFKNDDYSSQRPGYLNKHAVPFYAYEFCKCCNKMVCDNVPSASSSTFNMDVDVSNDDLKLESQSNQPKHRSLLEKILRSTLDEGRTRRWSTSTVTQTERDNDLNSLLDEACSAESEEEVEESIVPTTKLFTRQKKRKTKRVKLDDEVLHEGFVCDVCRCEIKGFRYTCVQCSDLDLCSACELDRAHHHHYVLRVPEPRPYAEIQFVLATIRRHLLMKLDPISQLEQDDDTISIKSEIKSEIEDDELRESVVAPDDTRTLHSVDGDNAMDNMVIDIKEETQSNTREEKRNVQNSTEVASLNVAVQQKQQPFSVSLQHKQQPVRVTVQQQQQPVNAAIQHQRQPASIAVQHTQQPVRVTVQQKQQPVNAAVPHQPQTVYAAVQQQPQPVNAAVPHQPQPVDTAVPHQLQPVNAAVQQQSQPANAAVQHQPQPVNAAVQQQPQPVNAAVPHQPQPVNAAVPHQPQPVNAAVQQQPQPVNAAVPHQPQPVNTAVPHQPQPVNAAVQQQPQPVNAAVQHQPQPVSTAVPHQPQPVNAAVQHQPQPVNAAVQHQPQPVNASVQQQPQPINSAVQQQPQPVNAAVQHQPQPVSVAVQHQEQPAVTSSVPAATGLHISAKNNNIIIDFNDALKVKNIATKAKKIRILSFPKTKSNTLTQNLLSQKPLLRPGNKLILVKRPSGMLLKDGRKVPVQVLPTLKSTSSNANKETVL